MILFSCKPEAEKPTVTTKSVGEVTETTAKVVGQVTADGGAEVTERGVCWNTAPAPEVIDYRTVDGTGIGTFNSNISDLVPNTQYYVRAYATNEKGVSYGEEMTLTTLKEIELPTVTTAEVKDVTETTAVSGGEVVSDGGAEVTARGICWSTKQTPTIEDNKTTDGSGVGSFTSNLSNLEPQTTYYVRAYATNEKGTAYGEEVSFTTEEEEEPEEPGDDPEQPGDEPEQPGDEPENPGDEPEEPGDEPEEPGDEPEEPGDEPEEPGDEPEEPGDEPEEPGDEPEEPGDEPEEPGDEPEEPGDEPEDPGDEPENPEQPVGPVVITAEVTEITLNSAVSGGEVVSGGDAVVIARGICYNTTGAPTVSDTYTMDGNGMGVYTSYMTDLELGTTYYVRAYATDVKGITSYGEEVTFTTLEKLLPIVTTATEVTNITVNSATCGGEVTFNGNVSVTARGICWSTSQNPTIEDNKTTDGSGVGSFTSQIPNLVPNTQYYVRAYATNEVGTAYGEEVTFTTLEKLLPTVATATEVTEVTDITVRSAKCGGEVTFDGNVTVTARGICWSTMPNPTIEDNKTTEGSGVGSFTSNLSNLEPQTTYYVRAYATNEVGTAYGEEVSFTTLERNANGYTYVDLGLPSGLLWATCNVGATTPEEYGDYFAWGETSTKETYDYDNCPTYGLSISQLQSQGYIDSEGNLTSQYDAARANWGGDWRMPTYFELNELSTKCTWTWTTRNGVNGYNVEGPNGNSIFLPAAGYRDESSLYNAGGYGYYWSPEPGRDPYGYNAFYLYFYSDNHRMYSNTLCYGRSVRPVLE